MRSLGLLYNESDCASNFELCSKLLKGIDLESTLPKKKVSYQSGLLSSDINFDSTCSVFCKRNLFFYLFVFCYHYNYVYYPLFLRIMVIIYAPKFKMHLSGKSSCFVYGTKRSIQATGSVAGYMAIKVYFLFFYFLL